MAHASIGASTPAYKSWRICPWLAGHRNWRKKINNYLNTREIDKSSEPESTPPAPDWSDAPEREERCRNAQKIALEKMDASPKQELHKVCSDFGTDLPKKFQFALYCCKLLTIEYIEF